jgi:3-oxoacyl-(acyl-carrier-protein) synthase
LIASANSEFDLSSVQQLTLLSLVACSSAFVACNCEARRLYKAIILVIGSLVGGLVALRQFPPDISSLVVVGMYSIAPALFATAIVVVFARTGPTVSAENQVVFVESEEGI